MEGPPPAPPVSFAVLRILPHLRLLFTLVVEECVPDPPEGGPKGGPEGSSDSGESGASEGLGANGTDEANGADEEEGEPSPEAAYLAACASGVATAPEFPLFGVASPGTCARARLLVHGVIPLASARGAHGAGGAHGGGHGAHDGAHGGAHGGPGVVGGGGPGVWGGLRIEAVWGRCRGEGALVAGWPFEPSSSPALARPRPSLLDHLFRLFAAKDGDRRGELGPSRVQGDSKKW